MATLITGGTGYIGAELARLLVQRGEEVVLFDIAINRHRIDDIEHRLKIVRGDLGNFSEVINAVKENRIREIYHLGAMLTYMSELHPWASFQTNVIGMYNVLEAARLFDVEKVMFTSTFGTFGLCKDEVLTDTSLQRPTTFYGCGKLYIEGSGRFYRSKFGLDFRSIRYAHMVGPGVRTPGHWAPPMIADVVLGTPNKCIYGTPKSVISMIYFKDAALAADMVMRAPRDAIQMVNYNVAGIPAVTSATALERALKTRYPGAKITYQPNPYLPHQPHTMREFNDDCARREWGWQPECDSLEKIIDAFERDLKFHPAHYGITL